MKQRAALCLVYFVDDTKLTCY